MDKKNLKILGALLLDSRASMTSIAKKAGVSREVALYRINGLSKQTIREFYTIIDFNALGFRRYGCFMQFKGISAEKEEQIIGEIANNDFINYVGRIIGKWNVVFDILAKDEKQLKGILDEILSDVKQYLDSYLINTPGTDHEYFQLKAIGIKHEYAKDKIYKQTSLDKNDKKILLELSKNSRTDYVTLSKSTKLSANAIKYRIKNMEKSGVILGYTVSLDYNILGLQFFNIQLKITTLDDKRFISFITHHPSILYYYKYIGQENWDIDIGVISKNAEEFRKVSIDIKKEFGEVLKIHDIYMIPYMVKDNIAPPGIFQ